MNCVNTLHSTCLGICQRAHKCSLLFFHPSSLLAHSASLSQHPAILSSHLTSTNVHTLFPLEICFFKASLYLRFFLIPLVLRSLDLFKSWSPVMMVCILPAIGKMVGDTAESVQLSHNIEWECYIFPRIKHTKYALPWSAIWTTSLAWNKQDGKFHLQVRLSRGLTLLHLVKSWTKKSIFHRALKRGPALLGLPVRAILKPGGIHHLENSATSFQEWETET